MWFSTGEMCSSQFFLVSRASSVSKFMIPGLGFTLLVTVGSFTFGYIFFTSMILIVSSVFFTLFLNRNAKQFALNHEVEECPEAVEEHEEVTQSVPDEEEGSGTGEDDNEKEYDDDHCMTKSDQDDEDVCDNYVARSSLSSEDDGSISDEDTLIELELPTGHYLSPKQYKLNNTKEKPRWMELLSEANFELATEEDNLIEIDIFVGSIICPRFEIEA